MFTRLIRIVPVVALFLGCAGSKAVVPKDPHVNDVEKPGEKPPVAALPPTLAESIRKQMEDSLRIQAVRTEGIQEWSNRVRSAVEPYWVLPKVLVKHKYRSVARIRAARSGDILNVTWVERSRSVVFNNLAAKALKKVKHLPAFPRTVPDTVLEIQYEFITPGIPPPRRKLELRKSEEG